MTGILLNCYEPRDQIVITVYDCRGDQLQDDWIRIANQFINYNDEDLTNQIKRMATKDPVLCKPNVMIVRESTVIPKSACNAAVSGVELLGGRSKTNIELTAAQLRYILNHSRLQSVYFTEIPITENKYWNDLQNLCRLLFKQSTKGKGRYENRVYCK